MSRGNIASYTICCGAGYCLHALLGWKIHLAQDANRMLDSGTGCLSRGTPSLILQASVYALVPSIGDLHLWISLEDPVVSNCILIVHLNAVLHLKS